MLLDEIRILRREKHTKKFSIDSIYYMRNRLRESVKECCKSTCSLSNQAVAQYSIRLGNQKMVYGRNVEWVLEGYYNVWR